MSSSRFNTARIVDYKQAVLSMSQNTQLTQQKRSNALPPPSPEAVARALGVQTITIDWLAGDGSDRCYYRLFSPEVKGSLVLMQLSGSDAQALKDGGYDWVKLAWLLTSQGVFVPRIVATMTEHSALIIEDYGDAMLEGVIYALAEAGDTKKIRSYYRQGAEIVARFLTIPQDPTNVWCKRSFDEERFVWELNFFMQKYARPVAGIELTAAEQRQFDQEVSELSRTLAANSQYFVHRDFHSRNIMVKDDKLAIIDFQDARLGPAAYDVVSLAFDSYVPFDAQLRSDLVTDALDVISSRCGPTVRRDVAELWKPTLLQRQLKAIGSFGFLTLDKQRGDYLKYVEPALRTLEEQNLKDARWPFVSGTLLERLRSFLVRSSGGSGA